jgi:hypothetical protein
MTGARNWEQLLDAPNPCDHFVQLYTDDAFLARAVTRFVGAGLTQGEAGVIISTEAHRQLFTAALADAPGAIRRGQLVLIEAERCLEQIMVSGMPDRPRFGAVVMDVLERVRAAGYPKTRFYGEMVDLLWERNFAAAARLEELWNEVLTGQQASLLCAYGIDNFDRDAQRGLLAQVSRPHSHLIPADDYERLDRAVDRAYVDVFGAQSEARALRELLVSAFPPAPIMPAAEAALLALRGIGSERTADAVLERAREYYRR